MEKISGTSNGIVVSSTQYTGYGGAATNAYNIVKYLRKLNYNVVGLFFHNKKKVNYNPDKLKGIFLYKEKTDINIIKNAVNKYLKCEPSICLAKNYMAPILCEKIFKKCTIIYLVSGISYFLDRDNLSAQDLLQKDYCIDPKYINKKELRCIKQCHLIICNSLLTRNIFKKIYGDKKLYKNYIDTSQEVIEPVTNVHVNLKPNHNKIYDIIICCSNLNRKQKNIQLILNLFNKSEFNKYKKIVIGDNYDKFNNIENTECKGLLTNTQCIEYMKQSKILLLTSFFDSNPNTVREALSVNCVPIISENIGGYDKYPPDLVCKSLNIDEWDNKIQNILTHYEKYQDLTINFDNKYKLTDLFN
jgi:glycosyltransferase involved in cell wall biosynthesis